VHSFLHICKQAVGELSLRCGVFIDYFCHKKYEALVSTQG